MHSFTCSDRGGGAPHYRHSSPGDTPITTLAPVCPAVEGVSRRNKPTGRKKNSSELRPQGWADRTEGQQSEWGKHGVKTWWGAERRDPKSTLEADHAEAAVCWQDPEVRNDSARESCGHLVDYRKAHQKAITRPVNKEEAGVMTWLRIIQLSG